MHLEFIFCLIQLDASVAQLVEHQTSDQKIESLNPTEGSILLFLFCHGFTNKPNHSAVQCPKQVFVSLQFAEITVPAKDTSLLIFRHVSWEKTTGHWINNRHMLLLHHHMRSI